MIFGVLRKVAVGARFLDRIDDPRPLFAQSPQLYDQPLIAFRQHRQFLNTRHRPVFLLPPSAATRALPRFPRGKRAGLSRCGENAI